MSSTFEKVIIFSIGAAIGSFATWKLIKTKYEKIAQEEIDSVKEVFYRKQKELEEKNTKEADKEPEEKPVDKNSVNKYGKLVNNLGYSNEKRKEEPEMIEKPYVISPDEFGEKDYDRISITYYSDGVLEDDYGDVIEDDEIDDMIGRESLETFGQYEDDSVFVRNDRLKIDYEILMDVNPYNTTEETDQADK